LWLQFELGEEEVNEKDGPGEGASKDLARRRSLSLESWEELENLDGNAGAAVFNGLFVDNGHLDSL
jgi:hypothetical protein